MYGGVMGKILLVDLGVGVVRVDNLAEHYVSNYIGGDGFAARLLYDGVPPGIDGLDSESRLVVSAGPLAGTVVQASCNYSVAAKSPITGFTIYNSHSNGKFARLLKFSGFDAIIIKGRVEKPTFLWINDGQAEIRDATFLWGKDTWETRERVKESVGTAKA